MSMTKNSAAFDAMMEEARRQDDRSHDEYLSEQYFRKRAKAQLPTENQREDGAQHDDQ